MASISAKLSAMEINSFLAKINPVSWRALLVHNSRFPQRRNDQNVWHPIPARAHIECKALFFICRALPPIDAFFS
jgi:hypothetical protein